VTAPGTGATGASAAIPAAEVAALPMPLHHLDRDGDGRSTARCDAPIGSVSRMGCAEECGAEVWPCGGYDYEADVECEPHPDDLFSVEGDPEAGTYAGPIAVSWQDDTYLWEPAEASSAKADS
jgi:hypothetical protein